MPRHHLRGKLHTGRTAVLLVALVGTIGALLWASGYLPFRLRDDGIYAGNGVSTPRETGIERPRLYLPAPDKKKAGHFPVTQVIDGDTIEIERSGKKERIRLIGIDCDEVGKDKVEPESYAWRATMFVFELLEKDPQVKLKYDKEREDKYGRTLAYVYLPDERMLNEVIMKEGWAKVMRIEPNTKHAETFAEHQTQAKAARKGMWQ